MVAGACLGDETIAAMLEGGLAVEPARHARQHISGCDACRRLVSAAIEPPAMSQTAVMRGSARPSVIAPGTVIAGRYQIVRLLGEGGMGRVFAAHQLGLEREVAVKILLPELARDVMALKRFEREARLVAQLTSEAVVRVHDLGALDSGEPYLVMELLDGEDLATVVERGPVAAPLAIAWITAVCDSLGEAHALGIVHRDIKPSNLFVTRAGRLVVLDFGLAKLAEPSASMTGAGTVLGSPRYMAPEQIRGAREVDARADIWSIGATLYHLVTGRPPFPQDTLEAVFASILAGQLPPFDDVRPDLAAVIHRALAFDPAARFPTTSALVAALRGSTFDQNASTLRHGDAFDRRFEIVEKLGQGAHGVVYRARLLPGGREVALKVLRVNDPALRERFAREAAIVQRLEHPNTVRLFESGVGADGAPFMVFELVRGRTLAAELARGPLASPRVAHIAGQVLKALMEAHAHGVVHRDVTPANILLVDHAGEPDFVKLLDFGVSIARSGLPDRAAQPNGDAESINAQAANLTATGQIIGTPRYMAPEQVMGAPVDARADLYALGLVMAEALAGTPVFAGATAMAVCAQQISPDRVPLPRAATSSPLGAAITRATQKAAAARFGSAAEMLAALAAPAPRTSRAAVYLAIALVVAIGGGIGIAVYATRRHPDSGEFHPQIADEHARIAAERWAAERAAAQSDAAEAPPPPDPNERDFLNRYVDCFDKSDGRIESSWTSYSSWVDIARGPTGKEPSVGGIDQLDDYELKRCVENLTAATGGPLAAQTQAYHAALDKLAPLVDEAKSYYEHNDYQDDRFARGKQLHGPLVAAFTGWRSTRATLRDAWDVRHRAARVTQLAGFPRDGVLYATMQILNAAEVMSESFDGPPERLLAALIAYQAAFDKLTAFFGPTLTASSNTDRYMFKQAADWLLADTKAAARRLRANQPLATTGDGSRARLVEKYNGFIDRANQISFVKGEVYWYRFADIAAPPVSLAGFDEARAQARLGKLGWKVGETTREELAGCVHTRIQATKFTQWADVTILTCDARATAVSEAERLRRSFADAAIRDDGTIVLDVASNTSVGSDARLAALLADALLK